MKKLLHETIEITRAAGDIIMRYFGSRYDVKDKSPDNPVTEADLAADRLLKQGLMDILPETGWLSEETVDRPGRLERERVWIVDPLDGTKEFIMGIPEFSISVALVEKQDPLLGVIYNPATDELFHGTRKGGCFFNGKKAHVTGRSDLEGALINASRSEYKRGEFDPFKGLLQIHSTGSTAYKLAQVAAGLCDASWSRGPKNEWDICSGVLLVEEAGGLCVDLNNRPFTFNRPVTLVNGFIADNNILHNSIIEMLAPYGPARK